MSELKEEVITCPVCGDTVEVEVYDGIADEVKDAYIQMKLEKHIEESNHKTYRVVWYSIKHKIKNIIEKYK